MPVDREISYNEVIVVTVLKVSCLLIGLFAEGCHPFPAQDRLLQVMCTFNNTRSCETYDETNSIEIFVRLLPLGLGCCTPGNLQLLSNSHNKL